MVTREYVARWRWFIDVTAAAVLGVTLGDYGWVWFIVGVALWFLLYLVLPQGTRRVAEPR
jgi:hypothetical protein